VIILLGEALGVCSAGEITNVTQAFQPSVLVGDAAARLPKKPGSQKLTPPSSAVATVGTDITAVKNPDAKAPINARRAIVGCVIVRP
jgi:hypothetical protein